MTPASVHLLATLIRHNRGMLNAFEKWMKLQPRTETAEEFLQVVEIHRELWAEYEAKLSHVEVVEVVPSGR